MTNPKPINVLFLCTHNSARSILAEACLNALGKGRFQAYSAGSKPRSDGQVNPLGLEALQKAGIPTEGLHSKSWDVFGTADAPHMDLIITVCDDAAKEVCPVWPGHPATAHWSYVDPSAIEGGPDEQRESFRRTLHLMRRRLELLVQLPVAGLDKLKLELAAREIAKA